MGVVHSTVNLDLTVLSPRVSGLTELAAIRQEIIVGIDKKQSRPLLRVAVVCRTHFLSECAGTNSLVRGCEPPKILDPDAGNPGVPNIPVSVSGERRHGRKQEHAAQDTDRQDHHDRDPAGS